jgi:hypothetical protein
MPCVGFETTIPASEPEKTVYALDRSATVTGLPLENYVRLLKSRNFVSVSQDPILSLYRQTIESIPDPYTPWTTNDLKCKP